MSAGDKVYLGMPVYGGLGHEPARAFYCDMLRPGSATQCIPKAMPNSLPTHGCNILWTRALESHLRGGATHFAMLHSDVAPEAEGWLDDLLDLIHDDGCDILSVAVAIKDSRGVTSHALAPIADPWGMDRNIPVEQLDELPRVFGLRDIPGADPATQLLLVNTGCMVVALSGDWWRPEPDGRLPVYFETQNRIYQNAGGGFDVDFRPEDWHFSRCAHERGAIIKGTSLRCDHHGGTRYPNYGDWGDKELRASMEREAAEMRAARIEAAAGAGS